MKGMKKIKSVLVIALALTLALSVFTGCGKKKGGAGNVDTSNTKYGTTYPLKAGDVTLSYWQAQNAVVAGLGISNYSELPIAKELEKKTGVKIEYVEASASNSAEKFNLMIAGGDLTDMIRYSWKYYPGGPQTAIDDGIILPLNDMMDAGWAPNFTKIMKDNPEVAKEGKTDEGLFYATGTVAKERDLNTTAGPIVRMDWLEELQLDVPETVEDWYKVLKEFKEKKGCTAPLSMTMQGIGSGAWVGAYKTAYDFYTVDGKVKYGPAEASYKEFLTEMNKWYKEGLLDPNFSTTDQATITANLINDKSGATWNALGGGIGALTTADPDALYGGAPYPTHERGKTPWFGQAGEKFAPTAAITTQCKDPELAMKWLDYGYSEEGHMLYNFGIEGTTYKWVDKDGEKYPQYTELVTKNPKGQSMSQVFVQYSQAGQGGNYCQDVRYLEQYAGLPQQQAAWKTWVNTDTFKHTVPQVNIAEEDATEYSNIYTDITTYKDEMFVKFVMGTEPLSNFDKYVDTLKKMGLDKITKMKQTAFDKYQKR